MQVQAHTSVQRAKKASSPAGSHLKSLSHPTASPHLPLQNISSHSLSAILLKSPPQPSSLVPFLPRQLHHFPSPPQAHQAPSKLGSLPCLEHSTPPLHWVARGPAGSARLSPLPAAPAAADRKAVPRPPPQGPRRASPP